jgi:AcrR family transcriptional regulator
MDGKQTSVEPLVAKTRQRLSAAERKAALLEGAAAIIRQSGLEGLTMESLAAHCGVNKALPYRHFANRDDVLVALYEVQNRRFDEKLQQALVGQETFTAQLTVLVTTWYQDMASGAGTPELMQARTQNQALESLRRVRIQVSVEFIADLIEEHYDLSRVEAKLAASVLLAGSQGLAAIWRTTDADSQALTKSFIRMSLGAVEAIAAQ